MQVVTSAVRDKFGHHRFTVVRFIVGGKVQCSLRALANAQANCWPKENRTELEEYTLLEVRCYDADNAPVGPQTYTLAGPPWSAPVLGLVLYEEFQLLVSSIATGASPVHGAVERLAPAARIKTERFVDGGFNALSVAFPSGISLELIPDTKLGPDQDLDDAVHIAMYVHDGNDYVSLEQAEVAVRDAPRPGKDLCGSLTYPRIPRQVLHDTLRALNARCP